MFCIVFKDVPAHQTKQKLVLTKIENHFTIQVVLNKVRQTATSPIFFEPYFKRSVLYIIGKYATPDGEKKYLLLLTVTSAQQP